MGDEETQTYLRKMLMVDDSGQEVIEFHIFTRRMFM